MCTGSTPRRRSRNTPYTGAFFVSVKCGHQEPRPKDKGKRKKEKGRGTTPKRELLLPVRCRRILSGFFRSRLGAVLDEEPDDSLVLQRLCRVERRAAVGNGGIHVDAKLHRELHSLEHRR